MIIMRVHDHPEKPKWRSIHGRSYETRFYTHREAIDLAVARLEEEGYKLWYREGYLDAFPTVEQSEKHKEKHPEARKWDLPEDS